MFNSTVSSPLGKAWAFHRNDQNDQALGEFQRLLNQNADDLDALYGSGLAQKALGQAEAARKSFQKAIDVAGKGLSETPGNDRFMMMRRMAQQRINEVSKAAPAP